MPPLMMFTTQDTMRELHEIGYTSEPHAAVAFRALRDQLNRRVRPVPWYCASGEV